MGACLKHSKSMLVLWDPSHAQQLQCTFELATFLKCHEGEKVHLDIRPTMLAPFFLVNLIGNVLIAAAQILVPFDHDWTIFVVAACFAPYFISSGWLLMRYFASVQALKDAPSFFSKLSSQQLLKPKAKCCRFGRRISWLSLGSMRPRFRCNVTGSILEAKCFFFFPHPC